MNIINLKDKKLYFIGGVVRDRILGLESYDIDLTYDGNAIEYAKTIENAEIIQINEPFGTVRIKLDNKYIDIASTRSETYPQKGHLPVIDKIGCPLKEDVMRRDFTINALAKSTLTGEIIDYTGGLEDIKNKKLRVLHDESFIDDPTRIIRALKFAVRFGFELDEHTLKLQKQYLQNINYDMSFKRLKKELIETFNLNKPAAFEQFIKQEIYKLISPQEFSQKVDLKRLELLVQKYKPKQVWLVYVGLLPDISNLPLTKNEKQIVDSFKNIYLKDNSNISIYKAFKDIPIESVLMYSNKNIEAVAHYLENLKDINLEITGENLQKLGVQPSEEYRKCFDNILEKKLDNPNITLTDEINIAKEYFKI